MEWRIGRILFLVKIPCFIWLEQVSLFCWMSHFWKARTRLLCLSHELCYRYPLTLPSCHSSPLHSPMGASTVHRFFIKRTSTHHHIPRKWEQNQPELEVFATYQTGSNMDTGRGCNATLFPAYHVGVHRNRLPYPSFLTNANSSLDNRRGA